MRSSTCLRSRASSTFDGTGERRHCCGSAAITPLHIISNTAVTPTRDSIRMILLSCRDVMRDAHASRAARAIGESRSKVNANRRI
jgi:hypothetical protein